MLNRATTEGPPLTLETRAIAMENSALQNCAVGTARASAARLGRARVRISRYSRVAQIPPALKVSFEQTLKDLSPPGEIRAGRWLSAI